MAEKTTTAPDVTALSYEEAREELLLVVQRLETGGSTLEDSLALWERGEALAARCEEWLEGARARLKAAQPDDYGTEFLDAVIAVKTVDGVDGAIEHIARYGSQHTDAIITECEATAERFLNRVDSAIVLVNASTQFADGGEFGFGGEIGIATGKMHARGPVGVEQLTSFKYKVRGTGQIRPK